MPSPEDIHEQQERLIAHRHTLAHHLKQQAILGEAHAPPGTSHGIRESRTEIARIKAILREWGVIVEDHPDDSDNDLESALCAKLPNHLHLYIPPLANVLSNALTSTHSSHSPIANATLLSLVEALIGQQVVAGNVLLSFEFDQSKAIGKVTTPDVRMGNRTIITFTSEEIVSATHPTTNTPLTDEHKKRRVDAAVPAQTQIGRPTEAWVQICLFDSSGFRNELPDFTEYGDEITTQDVREGNIRIRFPRNPGTGFLEPAKVSLFVRAPDFDIDKPEQHISVLPDEDTGRYIFFLEPKRSSRRSIISIDITQISDDGYKETLGTIRLQTEVHKATSDVPVSNSWILVALPLLTVATITSIQQTVSGEGGVGVVGPVTGSPITTGRGNTVIQSGRDTVHAGGDVTQMGGDYVRGDQIDAQKSQGFINRPTGSVSQHFGDTVSGDKVSGDITATGISGTRVSIGHKGQVNVQQSGDQAAFAQAFAHIYETINARSPDPDVSKDEITETVKDIEQEAQKGEQANENKLTRWLNNLAGMAEDVFEVTVAALTGPQAAFATVARKVAERAKGERK